MESLNEKNEKPVLTLCKTLDITREPMSIAMAYLPFKTTLEINIYYAVLNKIALHELKDRDLFDSIVKVEIPISEIGERNFERISTALKNLTNARLSLVNEQSEFCRYLMPIIGTEYSRNTGRIVVSLHPEIFEEFEGMVRNGYTSYQFWQILKLKKFFSKRLYEILSGRSAINEGKWDVQIEQLKRLLSPKEAAYPNFLFVQRALKETVVEMKATGVDLSFDYTLVRGTKNRVERVVFNIHKQRDACTMSLDEARNMALVADFESLSSAERNNLVFALLGKEYTFRHEQVNEILSNKSKMALFYKTHNRLMFDEKLKNVRNKTAYMATVLNFKNYSVARKKQQAEALQKTLL